MRQAQVASGARSDPEEDDWSETVSQEAQSSISEPDELRTVDVELIWTRFEKRDQGGCYPPRRETTPR